MLWVASCALPINLGINHEAVTGNSFAAPGLAAHFLSLPDFCSMLRNGPTYLISEAIKDYNVKAAYVRPDSAVLSVWNLSVGIDLRRAPEYDRVFQHRYLRENVQYFEKENSMPTVLLILSQVARPKVYQYV